MLMNHVQFIRVSLYQVVTLCFIIELSPLFVKLFPLLSLFLSPTVLALSLHAYMCVCVCLSFYILSSSLLFSLRNILCYVREYNLTVSRVNFCFPNFFQVMMTFSYRIFTSFILNGF